MFEPNSCEEEGKLANSALKKKNDSFYFHSFFILPVNRVKVTPNAKISKNHTFL